MPKVCAEIGLYRGGIITKPCLINKNMTQVSELIYQQGHAGVSHQCVAEELGALAAKWHTSAESSNFLACVISINLILLFMRFVGMQAKMGKVKKEIKLHSEIYTGYCCTPINHF